MDEEDVGKASIPNYAKLKEKRKKKVSRVEEETVRRTLVAVQRRRRKEKSLRGCMGEETVVRALTAMLRGRRIILEVCQGEQGGYWEGLDCLATREENRIG